MKILVLLLTITLLASCTNQEKEVMDSERIETKIVAETVNEIEKSMEGLDDLVMDESKVQLIKYSYANPAQEVNMDIKYNLDESGKITMIDISSDNYEGLGDFNTAAKEVVVGLTLEQASEVELISGASLTTAAFKEAIKTQL